MHGKDLGTMLLLDYRKQAIEIRDAISALLGDVSSYQYQVRLMVLQGVVDGLQGTREAV
jgi:hypothetical protein